ncbi:mycothiol transferase [Nocardia iowensis]|uniref:DinB family protein n=1 Tax=Nocardia iowensis TaxID=204891 RepID=A0ABX8RRD3_NOCIO|nr:DinB family protein [Nocardia iowensis]QXN90016.1 DinB family protein [Nocardia iowensis]
MTSADLLVDAFGRVRENVHAAVPGLTRDELAARLDPGANSIAWLVWHLTRVQDDHIADAAGSEQVWTAAGWAERFGLPFDDAATGYGDNPDEVAQLGAVSADLLLGYHDAVHARTVDYVSGLTDADLPRVVDTRFDPPVTLGVRLISVVDDDIQHAGQAAFIRGVLLRRR